MSALLEADEPAPVELLRAAGESPFLLTADHAGRLIPRALGDLGVGEAEQARHIGWDIGIAGVTRRLSAALDATAVLQRYSRLVVDCNRKPGMTSAFVTLSETTPVPGNEGLDEGAKAARVAAIFAPYHDTIARLIGARTRTVYVAMHSFTPVYMAKARPMHVAVLYNRRPALSRALAGLLRAEGGLVVGENAPYQLGDDTDYGVPVHAEARGLDYVEIEIRQDLIAHEDGQAEWAARLARLLPVALEAVGEQAEA
ncbi:N-formylglutamate amidohydrolase [Acidocella sp.]|uniref:N-formylglutamate amidohydrolase n=1 Tax=Acidocella sp. TaxID=50710 RepID=UPI0026127FE7|nr:N-formylglutamate amidohydrolase [Acidocella sp.]